MDGILLALALATAGITDDSLTLSTGETLNGVIAERSDASVVLEHPVLGRLEIPLEQLTTINGEAIGAAPDAEAESAIAPADAVEETDWDSRFELATSSSFGNTDSQDLTIAIVSTKETDRAITKFDARYFYGADNGDRTDNKFTTGFIRDWLFQESPWTFFADGRYDYDEFNSWEHRISGHVGPGYRLIDTEDVDLILRAGIGAAKERGSKRNQIIPEALFGGDLNWKINDRMDLVASSTIYPDLDETGEFRAVNSLNWLYKLDDESNLSLTVGVFDEYQSKVDPGIEHNDLKIFAGLAFDF